jgi:NAD-dependent dihydropyrimidine dehydrogenase PreA subunit
VRSLVDKGAKEVTLLGQNVNSYRDGNTDFPALLRRIHAIEGLHRIRFTTSHPKDCSEELIRTVATLPKLCKHLHLPVQSGSTRVLRLMNRRYTREQYLRLIDLIRKYIPTADITTDVMVGFPTETDADFRETVSLFASVRFTAAFMFGYSRRDNTPAAQMGDDVLPQVKQKRLRELIDLQTKITKEHYAAREGKTIYRLPRHIIQFHDASTLWVEAPPALLDLWRQYMEEEYPQVPAALKAMKAPPFFRVIPINENIESKSKVLAYEDAAQIIDRASVIAVTNCPCRMIMRKCDKPIDVCLQINRGAEYAIKRGTGRKIHAEEAKNILRRAEEAGLVHLTENKAALGTVICNCCACCCIGLPYMKNPSTSSMLVPSRYQAVIDGEFCTGCGICAEACPMDAISMIESEPAKLREEACIGCGVCTNVCPEDGIHLRVVRQEDFIPS